MPPGKRKPADVALKENEIERAQTMMRNARVFQSLGINTLASILNQSTAKSKGTAHEDNDPLYEPSGDENSEHGVVDKGQFAIEENDQAIKDACVDLLKCGQRQMRYKLKQTFFDGIAANEVRLSSPLRSMTDEQWQALVKMLLDPKHKEKCLKNKLNRENVRYQQRTGSRCYIAHCHVVKKTKYKDVSATAIDLFKECHRSRKNGFSGPVKNIIADMEAIIDDLVQDGEEPKTHTEVISQVMPKSKFLQNAGLESAAPKRWQSYCCSTGSRASS
uniref:Uncharacterized protein n=1 Tax=Oryza punctata TaxID=4537 RepID=A0A0E0LCM0_ORYPU